MAEAKQIVQKLNIKTLKLWYVYTKTNNDSKLPTRPDVVYISEWLSWTDFLKNETVEYLDYNDAKKIVVSNNIKDRTEYLSYIDTNSIKNLPRRPDYFYKEDGWSGWLNFTLSNKRLSIGEYKIKQVLDRYNIEYLREYIFKNLPRYKFDFYLPNLNTIIEFDGIQHFEPVKRFGGVKMFEKIKIRDLIKDKYCLDNNIKLIRISYKEVEIVEAIILNSIIF